MGIRYQVTEAPGSHSGWPGGQLGHAALMPHFNRHAGSGAQEYKGAVTGQPGTRGIPVEPVVPSPDPGDIALMGLSRSGDAPNVFYPNLYYTSGPIRERPGAGMPVSVYSDNLMPVPAVDPRGIPATLSMQSADRRGQRQIQAFPLLPRWANNGGG
jgi:hypothetical protein